MRCANCGNPKVNYMDKKYVCAYCNKTLDYAMADYLCKEIDGLMSDRVKNKAYIEAKKVRFPGLDWDGITAPIAQKKRTADDILSETKNIRTQTPTSQSKGDSRTRLHDIFKRPSPVSLQQTPTVPKISTSVQKKTVVPKKRCPKCGSEYVANVGSRYECRYCGDSFINPMVDYQAKEIEELLADPIKNKAYIEVKEIKYPAIRWDGYSAHKEMKRLSGEQQAQKSLDELKKSSTLPKAAASVNQSNMSREHFRKENVAHSSGTEKENHKQQNVDSIDEIQKRIIEFMMPFLGRLEDQKAVKSLLADCLPDNALEKNLMINAYVEGVCDEIRINGDRNMVLHKMSKKLVDNYGIMQEKAEWAVVTWIHIIEEIY